MKKSLFLTLILFVSTCSAFGATITAILSGSWNSTLTWDLGRLPQDGDTIIIPTGITVSINDVLNMSTAKLDLKIKGRLNMSAPGSKLSLAEGSTVIVQTGGVIDASGSSSQTIVIGGNTVYKGTDGPVVGPAYADASTKGFTFYNEYGVLPIRFLEFTLNREENGILVQWSTAEETNSSYYEVERSFDGLTWSKVVSIAAAGSSKDVHHYEFRDLNQTARTFYYRVRHKDIAGKATYTAVKSIRTGETARKSVVIAASNNKVVLRFAEAVKGPVTVRLISMNGQVAGQQTFYNATGQVEMNTSAGVRGLYTVSVDNGRNIQAAQKIVF